VLKTYITPISFLRLNGRPIVNRMIEFNQGKLSTDDPKVQAAVEKSHRFGSSVFLITAEDISAVNSDATSIQDIAGDIVGDVGDAAVIGNKCAECGKEFDTPRQLLGHMTHHKRNKGV
jgi:hypothetical protein